MKLVRGKRLDAWLAESPSLRERLDLLRRVAETVGFAHARGVVHRDLKPSNVMVGEFGEVLVLDWGLAKVSRSQGLEVSGASASTSASETSRPQDLETGHGTILGTEGFMAPEQQRGDTAQIDQRTDVYGLGALLRAIAAPLPKRL